MVKRLVWKENDLLVLKLYKDLYTVCQLHKKGFIQFYNFFTDNPKIKGVDFNEIAPYIPSLDQEKYTPNR